MQEKRHDCVVEMRLCFFSKKAGDYKMLFIATRKCRSTVVRKSPFFQFTTSQGGRQQIPTNIANICINSSLFCTPHPFLHTFILQFRITFPLCYSYIQCESLGIFCPLYIRTKELTAQSHQNWALFQYAPLCFYTYLPDYKIADCPIPCL